MPLQFTLFPRLLRAPLRLLHRQGLPPLRPLPTLVFGEFGTSTGPSSAATVTATSSARSTSSPPASTSGPSASGPSAPSPSTPHPLNGHQRTCFASWQTLKSLSWRRMNIPNRRNTHRTSVIKPSHPDGRVDYTTGTNPPDGIAHYVTMISIYICSLVT